MRKIGLLKAVIVLQTVCLIALGALAALKWPQAHGDDARDVPEDGGTAGGRESRPVAEIGGRTITEGELAARLMREHGPSVLRRMLVSEAIRLESEAHDITVSERELEEELARLMEGYGDEEAFYEAMREQLGMSPEDVRTDAEERLLLEKIAVRPILVTDEEVEDYIRQHPELLEPRVKLTFSWIVTEERDEAEAVLERLKAGEPFEEQAFMYSIDDYTAEYGGFYGMVEADDPFIDGRILELLVSLETGGIGGPVETADGWAVVRLEDREVEERPDSRRLREQVRLQLGLALAPSLREVEDALLEKYGARVLDDELAEGAGRIETIRRETGY
jgi:foldase protein PrsA